MKKRSQKAWVSRREKHKNRHTFTVKLGRAHYVGKILRTRYRGVYRSMTVLNSTTIRLIAEDRYPGLTIYASEVSP